MALVPLAVVLLALAMRFMTAAGMPVPSYNLQVADQGVLAERFAAYAWAAENCAEKNPGVTGTMSDAWLVGQGCLPVQWQRPVGANWTNFIPSAGFVVVYGNVPGSVRQAMGGDLQGLDAVSDEASAGAQPFTSIGIGINVGGSWWSPAYGYICSAGCIPAWVPNGAAVAMLQY